MLSVSCRHRDLPRFRGIACTRVGGDRRESYCVAPFARPRRETARGHSDWRTCHGLRVQRAHAELFRLGRRDAAGQPGSRDRHPRCRSCHGRVVFWLQTRHYRPQTLDSSTPACEPDAGVREEPCAEGSDESRARGGADPRAPQARRRRAWKRERAEAASGGVRHGVGASTWAASESVMPAGEMECRGEKASKALAAQATENYFAGASAGPSRARRGSA